MIVVSTELDPNHSWRKPGTSFAVQEIYVHESRPMAFRVEDNEGTPSIVEATNFEIVDGSVPDFWMVNEGDQGLYTFGPVEWRRPGFWEDWLDKDAATRSSYLAFRSVLED